LILGGLIFHSVALATFNDSRARRAFGLPERHPKSVASATETLKRPA